MKIALFNFFILAFILWNCMAMVFSVLILGFWDPYICSILKLILFLKYKYKFDKKIYLL